MAVKVRHGCVVRCKRSRRPCPMRTTAPWQARRTWSRQKVSPPCWSSSSLAKGSFHHRKQHLTAPPVDLLGIYVSVMFFDGFGLHLSPAPDNVEGHPFHAANNFNGISLLDRRLPGPPARPACPGAPGGVHPQGRRH